MWPNARSLGFFIGSEKIQRCMYVQNTSRYVRIYMAFLAVTGAKASTIHIHQSVVPPVTSAKLS